MDAKIFRINYKSDFILTLNSDAGWMTPFCIKFWTGAPSQAYFVGFDGTTYTHCTPVAGEPTKLTVQFDDHHLPVGDLKYQIAYHFPVADFPNNTEDEVLNQESVTTEIDGEEYQVMLDFNGETAPEIEFSLPAYANEAQRIANEEQRIASETQRVSNEEARIAAEETRQQNEQQRISREQQRISQEQQRVNAEAERVSEFASLKNESEAATTAANNAAILANEKARLAADKAALAQDAATLANAKAQLAADKAALAQSAATLANEKAALAQQKAEYAQSQGVYAKAQGDYAKAQGETVEPDHQRAKADHIQAAADHEQAGIDHARAESDHTTATGDHTQAGSDHTQAGQDHQRAEADHTQAAADHEQAGSDHTRAESDHTTATGDHTQAGSDHTQAGQDHARAESDHTASETATAAASQAATAANNAATTANNAAAAAAQATQEMERDVQTLIENTDAVLGADDIPQFDVTESYAIGDFVMKDGKLYKFLTGHTPGAWNPQEVQQTNLVTEVNDMVKSDYEEVIIDLKTETNDPLPNVEVVVTVEGEQSGRNLTTDAQGRCTTNVQKGLEYTVSCANVPNYLPVTDIVRRASLPTRYITVTYVEDDTLTRETVKITVGYSDQTLPKATWVRISYGGENYQLALNDQNIAETTVRLGTVYTVSFEDIDGYKTPSPQTYTASLHGTRNINVTYVAPVAGLKWLMKNNTERELNDVSDLERINGDIFGLIVQTSDLMAAGCSFVIPLPFLLTQSATGTGQWLSANVTVPQLNYFGSLQAALADFDGDANCAGIEQFIAESAQQGTKYTSLMVSNCRGRVGGAPSFDDTKNYEAGDYVVYRNYLHLFLVDHAAGPWVEGETQQMTGFLMPDGVVRKCFSPAFAQIYAFRLLRDKVNEFTTSVFGIGTCNIASGNWWSSTQCNANYGVYLSNGGFSGSIKSNYYNLLPVLAY